MQINEETEYEAIQLMERIGGSFARALAVAWQRADMRNQARLRAAFPELLEEFKFLAARDRAAKEAGA